MRTASTASTAEIGAPRLARKPPEPAVAELERSLIIERIKAGFRKAGAKKPGPKIVGTPSRTTLWRRSKM